MINKGEKLYKMEAIIEYLKEIDGYQRKVV